MRLNEDFINNIHIVKDKVGNDYLYDLNNGNYKIGEIMVRELDVWGIERLFDYYPFLEKYLDKRSYPIYEIHNYGINNSMREMGYGKYLLDEVINDFGKYTLILQAGGNNEKMSQKNLVKMYERNGFKVLDGFRNYGCFMIRKPD